MSRQVALTAIATILLAMFLIFLGPMDGFRHGYYPEEIDISKIDAEDWLGSVSTEEGYEMELSPQRNYITGFEIYLTNQPEDNTGFLKMEILNSAGKTIDVTYADLSEVTACQWYKVYLNKGLKRGKTYTLRFTPQDCACVPYLLTVSSDYLPEDTASGNVLLSYAYKDSTFSFQERLLLIFVIIALWSLVLLKVFNFENSRKAEATALFVIGLFILTWNYMHNTMDVNNSRMSAQDESEWLVTSMVLADHLGVNYDKAEDMGFGLGLFYDVQGEHTKYGMECASYDEWTLGYSRYEPKIIVNDNEYTRNVSAPGNYIKFANGEIYQITDVEYTDQEEIIMTLGADKILHTEKQGKLEEAEFLDTLW